MSPAHVYHWRSKALKQYGEGHLIAVASTAEHARTLIRANIEAHWRNEMRPWDTPDTDEDDREDLTKFLALIETDLTADPEISDTLFLAGSE